MTAHLGESEELTKLQTLPGFPGRGVPRCVLSGTECINEQGSP